MPLLLGAAGGVLIAAVGIALVARDTRAGGDIGVAVVVSGLFGLGGILALSPETPPRLGELLFGDLLGVTNADLVAAAVLCAGVLVALAVGYRALTATGFARGSAAALGVRPGRADLALLALLAVTTVAAVQGLGNLLLVALVLAPGAAALNLARRLPSILALAAAPRRARGRRGAGDLLRVRDRGGGERRSVRRRTFKPGALETKVRHAII